MAIGGFMTILRNYVIRVSESAVSVVRKLRSEFRWHVVHDVFALYARLRQYASREKNKLNDITLLVCECVGKRTKDSPERWLRPATRRRLRPRTTVTVHRLSEQRNFSPIDAYAHVNSIARPIVFFKTPTQWSDRDLNSRFLRRKYLYKLTFSYAIIYHHSTCEIEKKILNDSTYIWSLNLIVLT